MKLNRKISLIIIICMVFLQVGCIGKEEKTYIRVAHPTAYISLDPQENTKAENGSIISHLFEGLVRVVDGKIVPGIAENYEISTDKLTYIFHLRDSRWSDFKKLNAEDFKYSWLRAIEPGKDFIYANYFFPIKNAEEYYKGNVSEEEVGIKITDPYTLEISLEEPTPWFLETLSYWFFMPVKKDIVEQFPFGAWALDSENCICNGPFKLLSREAGKLINLVPNENYWQADKISLTAIQYAIETDPLKALERYEAGEMDLVIKFPEDRIPSLQKDNLEYHDYSSYSTMSIAFNLNRDNLIKDMDFRKAIIYSVNRGILEAKTFEKYYVGTDTVVPFGLLDYNDNPFFKKTGNHKLVWDDSELDNSKQIINKYKEENKTIPTLKFIVENNTQQISIAEEIKKMLEYNLGVSVEIQIDVTINIDKIKQSGDYDICFFENKHIEKDPYRYLEVFKKGNFENIFGYSDESFDELLNESIKQGGMLRYQTLYQADELLMSKFFLLPLYSDKEGILIKGDIRGYTRNRIGDIFFGRAFRQ